MSAPDDITRAVVARDEAIAERLQHIVDRCVITAPLDDLIATAEAAARRPIHDALVDVIAILRAAPSSTEDTPPHVHTDACMCDMVPMDVVGAYECHHCGGHDGGPCGSLCEVAYDEITATPATPEPRVWREGDDEPDDHPSVTDVVDRRWDYDGRHGFWVTDDAAVRPWSTLRFPLTEVLPEAARGDR